jgi:hypothetical protein
MPGQNHSRLVKVKYRTGAEGDRKEHGLQVGTDKTTSPAHSAFPSSPLPPLLRRSNGIIAKPLLQLLVYQERRAENQCYYDSKPHNLCHPAFIHQGVRSAWRTNTVDPLCNVLSVVNAASPIHYISDELRIALEPEVVHRLPNAIAHGCACSTRADKPLGTLIKECTIYLFHKTTCYSFSSIGRGHSEPIDVTRHPSHPPTTEPTSRPSIIAMIRTAFGSRIKRVCPSIESETLGGVTSASIQSWRTRRDHPRVPI